MPSIAAGRRILIVDDDANVAASLLLILLKRGFEVRAAYSAEEAIDVIATWSPDLAILDVMLPQMNGIELGGVLNANYPDCRVLLVSGHPDTGDLLDMAAKKGLNFEIFAKPLHPTLILEIASSLMPETSGAEAAEA